FGGGLVLPWLLQTFRMFRRQREQRFSMIGIFISLLALVGGYFLRHTLIYAGKTSSRDARTTLWNARR
ncbi:MAG TPA: hypothetical protein DHW02_18640, partial [Ktedonobacter sp.]|nr:hypothetical protein [Ktedonobacter sp.]